jgi:DNA polymerase-4
VLIPAGIELFEKLYQRRMLIRLVGIKFSHLVSGVQQLNMFEDTPEMVSLYNAMDTIRLRYGKKAVRRAVGL